MSDNDTNIRIIRMEAWEPGNGSRYEVLLVPGVGMNKVFAWLNAPGGGRCMYINPYGVVHSGYLMEKMALRSIRDAAALLRWLHNNGVEVYLEEEHE